MNQKIEQEIASLQAMTGKPETTAKKDRSFRSNTMPVSAARAE